MTSKNALVLSSLLAMLLALSPVASAMCAMEAPIASLVTSLTQPIPKDGALLVRLDMGTDRRGPEVLGRTARTYDLAPMALVRGDERIPLVVHRLRAGLLRLDFARPPEDGEHMLEGFAQGSGLSVIIGGTLPAPPAAPVVTEARHEERTSTYSGPRGGEERSTRWDTRLVLGQRLPAEVSLLAMRPAGRAGAHMLLAPGSGRTTVTETGQTGGHCSSSLLPGRGRAWRRMQAEVSAFDRYGRESPPSATFTVR